MFLRLNHVCIILCKQRSWQAQQSPRVTMATHRHFLSLCISLELEFHVVLLVVQQHLSAVLQMGLRFPGVVVRGIVLPADPVQNLPLRTQDTQGHEKEATDPGKDCIGSWYERWDSVVQNNYRGSVYCQAAHPIGNEMLPWWFIRVKSVSYLNTIQLIIAWLDMENDSTWKTARPASEKSCCPIRGL